MWFRDKPPPKDLPELIQRNLGRTSDAPSMRVPAAAETHRRPIGPTAPLPPVHSGHN